MRSRDRRGGFSLIEIMITLVVLSIALAAAGSLFNNLLGDFRQQSKITETGMEANIGLQMLKKDLENAGYGLPWNLGGLGSYGEAAGDPFGLNGGSNPPAAFSIWNDNGTALDNSDYLVVRSMSIAGTEVSRKWTTLATGGASRSWGLPREDFDPGDRVIVVRPGPAAGDARTLHVPGGTFAPAYSSVAGANTYAPPSSATTYLMYGLTTDTPRMPFNRADYFVLKPSASGPPICAPGTGTLVKAIVNHDSGGSFTILPLLDCVLDMQVVFQVGDNNVVEDDLTSTDAQWVRDNVRQVFVYILTHEGRRDERYEHDQASILVGAPGRDAPIVSSDQLATDQSHYRWKVYELAVRPTTLR